MQSRKEELLERIRTKIRVTCDMPDLLIDSITFPDRVAQFKVMLQAVGGEAIELVQGENMQELICSRFPESKIIASNLPEISFATINPDQVDDPHELAYIDLAIIRGEIGVAENACIWIPQMMKERVVCFIAEYLVVLLERSALVNNMHEAYEQISFHDKEFGVFISGPSKTADIEQALVIGAHGAKGVLVILT